MRQAARGEAEAALAAGGRPARVGGGAPVEAAARSDRVCFLRLAEQEAAGRPALAHAMRALLRLQRRAAPAR